MPRKTNPNAMTTPAHDDHVADMMAALLPLHRAVTVEWLADAAATAAERGIGAPFAFVYFDTPDGRLELHAPASDLRRRSQQRASDAFGAALRQRIDPATSDSITTALEAGGPRLISGVELFVGRLEAAHAERARARLGVRNITVLPLETAGERIGALVLMLSRDVADGIQQLLADHVACAAVNLRNAQSAREQGVTDVVRSVFDQRKVETDLQRELARAERYRREVSIVVIQATNLRLLREQFGSFLADRLLQRLGEVLAENARNVDEIGAYRDSGYTMILTEAEPEAATVAARRLLALAAEARIDGNDVPGLELHLVAGWATCPVDGTTTDAMFLAAERRMYDVDQAQVA